MTTINTRARDILISWLFEVAQDLEHDKKIAHIARDFFDKVASKETVVIRELQCVGLICYRLALKTFYQEERLSLSDLPQLCDNAYTEVQFKEREIRVLKTIDRGLPVIDLAQERMRTILISWLFEVAEELYLDTEIVQIAINLFDRVLAKERVKKGEIQCVGLTCLWLSSTYLDDEQWSLSDLPLFCDRAYTKEQFKGCQIRVLNAINWNIDANRDLMSYGTAFEIIQNSATEIATKIITQKWFEYLLNLSLFSPRLTDYEKDMTINQCLRSAQRKAEQGEPPPSRLDEKDPRLTVWRFTWLTTSELSVWEPQ